MLIHFNCKGLRLSARPVSLGKKKSATSPGTLQTLSVLLSFGTRSIFYGTEKQIIVVAPPHVDNISSILSN